MFHVAADRFLDALAAGRRVAPAVSIVVPTYNERGNVRPLVAAIASALGGTAWELIFVDDDSADGTADAVRAIGLEDARVRCLHRIGRRGLSSAVVEGALAAQAPLIAVMDADFQHDERALVPMLARIARGDVELVVASRHVAGGGSDGFAPTRAAMSALATRLARLVVADRTTDPMSGFFVVRRDALLAAVPRLSQSGYKILLDLITSAPASLRIAEVPYRFRGRAEGESKLGATVLADYAGLLIEKLTRGLVPARFLLFGAVGGAGLVLHLAVLAAMKAGGAEFLPAQTIALGAAMLFNYAANNAFTYRDRRRRGLAWVTGLALFCLLCSIGAAANVGVADLAIRSTHSWTLAGIAGAVMGAAFNFGAASSLVWSGRRRPRR